MALIKTNYYFAIIILLVFSMSCSKDNASNSQSSANEFTVLCCPLETPNAFLVLDDGPNFTNAFRLVFTDGILRKDNVNGIGISTNTTNIVWLAHKFGSGTVTQESAVTNAISNATHAINEESATLINISNWTQTYMHNGQQYGTIDESGSAGFPSTSNFGSIIVNNFVVDLVARNGTINCDYTYVDGNNITISGHFNGAFDIINEF